MYDLSDHLVDHAILGITSGGGGSFTGSGTAGTIPIFNGVASVTDSLLSQDHNLLRLRDFNSGYYAVFHTDALTGDATYSLADGGGYLVAGSGTPGSLLMWDSTVTGKATDSGISWSYNSGNSRVNVSAYLWEMYSGLTTTNFYMGVDSTHALLITRDSGTGIVTFTTGASSPVGSFAFGRSIIVTGDVSVTDDAYDATTWDANANVPTKNAVRDKIQQTWWLDGTAQTLTASKTVTMAAASPLSFAATSTGTTPVLLQGINNSAVTMWKLYAPTSTGGPSRIVSFYDTGGTERTFIRANGILNVYDGATSATAMPYNASSANTVTGAWTFNTAAASFALAPRFQVGSTVGTGSDGNLTIETIDLATDATVTWTQSATSTLPARTRSFLSQNLAMDPVTDGVAKGMYWPATVNSVPSYIFSGTRGTNFNGFLDAIYFNAYNTDGGGRFNTGTYSFYDSWEYSYDHDATAGMQAWIEKNYEFQPADGSATWRPFGFLLDTTAFSGKGKAKWNFYPNNQNSGNNNVLELDWPHYAFGRDAGIDSYSDSGMSSFMYVSNMDPASFGTVNAQKSRVRFDLTGTDSYTFPAFNAQFDFTPTSITSGTAIGFYVPPPTAPGTSSTVAALYGVQVDNLNLNRTGFTAGQAIYVSSQTSGTGAKGNVVVEGTGYNHGHYVIGQHHFWEYVAGGTDPYLRIKWGTPSSDTDGNVVLQSTFNDGLNVAFGTTTGTKLGTSTSQKLSVWNATPIVQPTTGIAASTFVANTSLIANDTATWDGYTMGQVVKALRNFGVLA